ncbi:MAG TPA: response regulator, partial [Anaerolineaceae bacterium]|nr:response regulator [Anaerolineaceae bacterium]
TGVKKILIVSFNEISIGENALQHGFAGYLTKPLKQTQLINLLTGKKSETAQVRADSEAASPDSTAYPIRRNGTILLAEDHPTNRRLAILQLHKMGFNIDTVPDGRQAVERVLHGGKAYSLVLMDCRMPEMDGFEATRIIREAELSTGLHVPIVAMTANAVQGDREACLAAGMDDYISKPVRFEDLKKTLARWYPEGTSLALDERGNATPTPTAGEAVLDAEVIAGIRSLQMDGEPDVMTMLVDIYLDDSLKTFEKINPQLAENNPQLRQTLHALRGSSLNLGSRRFARLCAELEALAAAGNFDEVREQVPALTAAFEELRNALSSERQPAEDDAEIR